MANQQVVRGIRPGGRSAQVRRAILDATFAELIDGGYAALSVEGVASRAGVNKTTVYRRWPTLEDLLVDALTAWSDDFTIPETGDIESDLLELGKELARILNGGVGRQIAAIVLTRGLQSAQLREATRRYFDHQNARAVPAIDRAIARKELPANCDANAVLTTFRAPLFYRVVTTGDAIDDELITHAARLTVTAARAGLLSR